MISNGDYTSSQIESFGLNPNETNAPQMGPDGTWYKLSNNGRGGRFLNITNPPAGAGGGGATSYPKFNFDWEKARKDALTQLTPYYEQKLKDADFDVERAKKLIEEDYKMGLRISQEDLSRTEKYGAEDLAKSLKDLGLTTTEETRDLVGSLNKRGVYTGQIQGTGGGSAAPVSNYAQTWHLGPLKESQDSRKLAIERAVQRQNEIAQTQAKNEQEKLLTTRTRGLEEQNIALPRYKGELEEEKRKRAFEEVAPMKYSEEYAKYRAVNNLG